MKEKNSGFTLIELLISMAILAVIGTAIGSFLYTGIKQYYAAGSEVSVQTEAQMVQNQIQNLLIDATKGIGQGPDELIIYSYDADTGKKEKIVLSYRCTDGEILYTRYYLNEDPAAGGGVWSVDEGAEDENFASYVTEFSVIMKDMDGKVITETDIGKEIVQLEIHILYELEKKKYESDFVTKPRNKVILMDPYSDTF